MNIKLRHGSLYYQGFVVAEAQIDNGSVIYGLKGHYQSSN